MTVRSYTKLLHFFKRTTGTPSGPAAEFKFSNTFGNLFLCQGKTPPIGGTPVSLIISTSLGVYFEELNTLLY